MHKIFITHVSLSVSVSLSGGVANHQEYGRLQASQSEAEAEGTRVGTLRVGPEQLESLLAHKSSVWLVKRRNNAAPSEAEPKAV
jgi:hypothetical protein